MIAALFAATSALYAFSCVLYLVFLTRGNDGAGRWAKRTLAASVLLHAAFLCVDYIVASHLPLAGIYETLASLSFITALFYLAATRKYRITVLGAFITPVTLLFFMGSGFARQMARVPSHVRSALLPLHITVNILGIGAFALAFAAASGYLLQEHLLRHKQVGGVFQRLPALDVLDALGFRAITVGFPMLTIGIVTGTIWAVRLDPSSPQFSASQLLAIVAWALFAGVLLLRVSAGWRGRRAAIGTVLGFLCAISVLVGYVMRSILGAP